jgi:acetyl esterase/lipase
VEKNSMNILVRLIGVIALIVATLSGSLVCTFAKDQKIQQTDQQLMIKSEEERIGERLSIQRENKNDVDVNLYLRDGNALPLVINLHGGAFIAGDADTLDTQSDRISKDWNVNVATINYSLLNGSVSKQDVVEEITDTVCYFIKNKETYHIDPDQIFIMGYSAGGYYAAAATRQLYQAGVSIKGQILCYTFISDMADQFALLSAAEKAGMPSALFVTVKGDPISQGSLKYETLLRENGAATQILSYENVKHGFIEENNPEYEQLHDKNKTSKSPEAEKIAREAESAIGSWIRAEAALL